MTEADLDLPGGAGPEVEQVAGEGESHRFGRLVGNLHGNDVDARGDGAAAQPDMHPRAAFVADAQVQSARRPFDGRGA